VTYDRELITRMVDRLRRTKPHCNFGSDLCAKDAHDAADAILSLLARTETPAGEVERADRDAANRTRQALDSFSTDIEDTRVLRVRFDRKHDSEDRRIIILALNRLASADAAALAQPVQGT